MAANDYILGEGVIAISGTAVALTRGGSQFTIERTYREVIADGDYGPVKDRIRKDGSRVMLTLRALELLPTNLPKMYPATNLDSVSVPGTETWEPKDNIETADYQDTVTFTGKTASGKNVIVTIENAICLGNPDWPFTDKDEVVPEIVYTGTYLETARTTEPWKVDFVTP